LQKLCDSNDTEFLVKKHDVDRETHTKGMHAFARLDPESFTADKGFSAEQSSHPAQKGVGKDQIISQSFTRCMIDSLHLDRILQKMYAIGVLRLATM